MSEFRPTHDNEIDMFEFFETLWDGKWLISAFAVLAALMGFGYTQVAQPKYDVSVPYELNVYSVRAQQICNSSFSCIKSEDTKRLLSVLDGSWKLDRKEPMLFLSTSSPLDVSEYKSRLERANAAHTNEIYIEATSELNIIQTELPDTLLSSEIIASNMLNAKRIILSLDNGVSAVSFGSISVVKSSLKIKIILVFSAVLGGIFGVFFIQFHKAVKKRKEPLSKE